MIQKLQNSDIEVEIGTLEMEIEDIRHKTSSYRKDITRIEEQKKQYVQQKNYKEAKKAKDDITELEQEIEKAQSHLQSVIDMKILKEESAQK